jgi:D-psicose/D-tagatose/L-ribulose 3-epimerase
MTRIGVHSFVWAAGSSQDVLQCMIESTVSAGYDLIEFSYLNPTEVNVDWLAKALADAKLGVAISMGLPPEGDVSSEDPAVVSAGESLLRGAVALTRDLGGTVLGGILSSAHAKYDTFPTRLNWDTAVEAISRVARMAEASKIVLNLEIVNRFESNLLNTLAQGASFINDTGARNVMLHADTFHMNIEEPGIAQAIRQFGKHIGYMHIGESHRGALGTGNIDFGSVFDALVEVEYQGDITFESFSRKIVDTELSLKTGIWRDLWSDNLVLARQARSFIDLCLNQSRERLLLASA